MHTKLRALRAKIRGFQSEGQTLASYIHKTSGERRSTLWDEKRRLGEYTRLHLVAYGLLRGRSYESIEKCARQNRLDPRRVFETMWVHSGWLQQRELTLERVKALLDPPERPLEKRGGP